MGRIQKLREQRKLEAQQEQIEKAQRTKKVLTWSIASLAILALITYGVVVFVNNKATTSSANQSNIPSATPISNLIVPSMNPLTSSNPQPEISNKTAVIETDRGNIKLELYSNDAPKTVANFVDLANKNFYNGLTFHRVVPGFVIQGGDPKGDGTGGPGYTFEDEINPWSLGLSDDAIKSLEAEGYKYTHDLTSHKVTSGALAMANSGPNTNGSQFFIVSEADQPHLDGRHTVFGRVIEGMDVVRQIQQGDIIKRVYIEK